MTKDKKYNLVYSQGHASVKPNFNINTVISLLTVSLQLLLERYKRVDDHLPNLLYAFRIWHSDLLVSQKFIVLN